MLTFEENGWNFKAIQISSALNLLPLEIDVKTGQVGKQSSKLKTFLWRTLFSFSICHWIYVVCRLVQSTILQSENHFRWDHFVVHFPCAFGYFFLYCIGFCLFEESPQENVIIFNQLFKERETPVQKMMDQELQIAPRNPAKKGGNRTGKKSGRKSALQTTSFSITVPIQALEEEQESKKEVYKKSGPKKRPLLSWPPQYSLDELLAKMMPLAFIGTSGAVIFVLALDPTRPQLLYSVLPPELQNLGSFLGLFVVEAVVVTFTLSAPPFSIVCQLLFFAKCQAEFKRLDLQLRNLEEKFQSRLFKNRDIRREIWILRQITKEIKELVLFIEIFNRVFPPCIFAQKLACFLSILFYFFTIRHFQDFPLLAVFSGYIAMATTLIYGILYQKAFSIPQKMERLKRELLLAVQQLVNSNPNPVLLGTFRAEMTREIGALRDVGVKVGSFHTLERESTPNYIDFVLRNVVNLLVTFPR